ncbi:ribonuclease H [Candidatus Collierbacteria bacterium CG10_big_fil_rev_8_21_14_0_10_44_9]|uniref:Ribonuclease H n=1 Tax=Candidatus Collierbacteria bacterium CG10_big_fil_rev_8_21_14_0_10_44_9 TaxID=1974535 RepID=A0A2H0VIN7_9BACT|nr:MAG: ribonuclease H [Candidatus Collierbacteria bacterium CG10_big_fil_rev_8_21_14_0_10_44_9]
MTKLLLHTDGGSRGNPGPAAYGYVIQDVSSGAGIILEKCGNYLGITTNNIAEYEGLIAGIKWVVTNHPKSELVIKMDSLLIVNQIKGVFKVKNSGLIPKYREVRGLLAQLPKYSIEHTYREGNSLADSLVNQALDAER